MKCPNCSYDNPEGAAFCNRCGTKLNNEKTIESPTQKNNESSFIKKLSSFFFVGSIIFMIYLFFCIKIPNREVEKYKYDDHIEHVAFVSDPLNILTCQSSESSVSEAEALKKAKDRYILVILFFGGIGATVCIVSVWIKK